MAACLVSVVIPVYNGERLLEASVDSVLQQDFSDFEIILVDDGSTDGSRSLIESLASSNPKIRAFSKPNGGVAHARNFAIEQSRAPFIAFCDQDDLWESHKLSSQLPLFDDPEVGLVFSNAYVELCQFKQTKQTRLKPLQQQQIRRDLVNENLIMCCTVIARKDMILRVSGFDDDRRLMGVDDWHLWLKLSRYCRFDYVSAPLAKHIIHENNYSLNDQKMHQAELVCISKIEAEYGAEFPGINWAEIKSAIHRRYAKNYVFSGEFKLAGSSLLLADQCHANLHMRLRGYLLKLIPSPLLTAAQQLKRRF
ncbi:glycosyltransferase family 2 protein [Agarivorans sp. QJM3NY_25]|uniref:glycosyltransferase family 2 protein n=1 Tax=Agarivorans sp. QJM3NY_25 TaxID=3421430 RepID=UPI003D7D53A8